MRRQFPVMISFPGNPWKGNPALDECPTEFDFRIIAGHEKQALRNHSQTLDRLAQRGGLTPDEIMAVLENRDWRNMDISDAVHQLNEYLGNVYVCAGCDNVFIRPPYDVDDMGGVMVLFCRECAKG